MNPLSISPDVIRTRYILGGSAKNRVECSGKLLNQKKGALTTADFMSICAITAGTMTSGLTNTAARFVCTPQINLSAAASR